MTATSSLKKEAHAPGAIVKISAAAPPMPALMSAPVHAIRRARGICPHRHSLRPSAGHRRKCRNTEAEAKNRRELDDILQIHVRSKDGEMVPMRSIANLRFVVGPQVITRYNSQHDRGLFNSDAVYCLSKLARAGFPIDLK